MLREGLLCVVHFQPCVFDHLAESLDCVGVFHTPILVRSWLPNKLKHAPGTYPFDAPVGPLLAGTGTLLDPGTKTSIRASGRANRMIAE